MLSHVWCVIQKIKYFILNFNRVTFSETATLSLTLLSF